jgi:hypothetical protein
MEEFFLTILHSWGSDTPQEVFWGLNDLIEYAKTKGFVSTDYFDNPLDYDDETNVNETNERLIKNLSEFFDKLK